MPRDFTETAWNGLAFAAPAEWVPVRIGPDALSLADGDRPVLEVRWRRGKRPQDPGRALARLKRRQERAFRRRLVEAPLPPAWQEALLPRFQAAGFHWEAHGAAGLGAVLCCPACRTVTLLQFRDAAAADSALQSRLLPTFADHPAGETVPFAMFDIRAGVPREWTLRRHRFEAGYFELSFAAGREALWLFRWGPAAVLLEGRSLEHFGRGRLPFPFARSRRHHLPAAAGIEWEVERAAPWFNRRWGEGAPFKRLRLWEVPAHGRILGVLWESGNRIPPERMDALCKTYEIR